MKLIFRLLIGSIFITSSAFSQQIDNQDFGSPEERIVYNKQNNIPHYDGILVEYEYRITTESENSDQEWLDLCGTYFEGLIGVDVYAVNNMIYFSALTEGSSLNNQSSYSIPVDLGYQIEFVRRRYHLK